MSVELDSLLMHSPEVRRDRVRVVRARFASRLV